MAEGTGTPTDQSSRSPLFYGWLIVGVCLLINFVSIGGRSSFTVFILPLEADFGWDRGEISLAASIGLLVNGFSQPFLGRVYDRYGARRVVVPSLIILGVSMLLLMQTFHLVFLIAMYGIVQAVATSGAGDPITGAMLAKWFRRHRATVLGISMAGASIGGMLLVPFTQYLISTTNWRTGWVVLGALILIFALPAAFFIFRESPEKMGLQPDGDAEPERQVGRSRKGIGGSGQGATGDGVLEEGAKVGADLADVRGVFRVRGDHGDHGDSLRAIRGGQGRNRIHRGAGVRDNERVEHIRVGGNKPDLGQDGSEESARAGLRNQGARLCGTTVAAGRIGDLDFRGDRRLFVVGDRAADDFAGRLTSTG